MDGNNKMQDETIKLPTIREVIDFFKKKETITFILVIAVLVLLFSGYKLVKIYKCKQNDGIYMEGGSCYVPKSDAERQKILEQGFVMNKAWDDNLNNIFENISERK